MPKKKAVAPTEEVNTQEQEVATTQEEVKEEAAPTEEVNTQEQEVATTQEEVKEEAAPTEEVNTQEQEVATTQEEVKEEAAPTEEVNTQEQEAENPETEEKSEEKAQEEEAVVISAGSPQLNPTVQKLLRIFNSYDELYITADGGVFPRDNKPAYVKGAVLYKNPFFKK